MRELFINGKKMDLDEKTAIGLTFQSGDISEPCKNRLSLTNTFQLPFTSNNIKNLEFSNNPFTNSDIVYDKVVLDYYDGGIPLIQNSLAFVQSINDNFNISVVKGSDFIETLKYNPIKTWLIYEVGMAITGASGFIGDVFYTDPDYQISRALLFDDLMGKFAPTTTAIEFIKPITVVKESLSYETNENFGIKLQAIFDFIETIGIRGNPSTQKYKIIFNGTTSQNSDFANFVLPFPFLKWNINPAFSGIVGMQFVEPTLISNSVYSLNWLGQKTMFDLFKAICNLFNAYMDIDDKTKIVKITTLNKVLESTTVLDWSKKLIYTSGKNNKPFDFALPGWSQKNIINYKYDDGVTTTDGKIEVLCGNLNIEVGKKIELNLFIPRAYTNVNNDIFYLSGTTDIQNNPLFTQKGIEEISLFMITGLTNGAYYGTHHTNYIYQCLPIDFSSNYDSMRDILEQPKMFKPTLNLNILDIYNFSPENLVKIESMGGVFYVNKINGFNSKSQAGTSVELIKVR